MRVPSDLQPIIEKHQQEAPVKLGRLAADLGLEVFKSTLKPGISGLIEPSETAPSGFCIKINRHEPINRQRFTLAHEIAHFVLHKYDIGSGLVDDVLYRSRLSDWKEVEANRLASQILMPTHLIKREISRVRFACDDQMIDSLASTFRVSKEAMKIKLGL